MSEMTYTKAIEMIKSGDPIAYNRGYEYLYYSTYSVNNWDLTKILKNEQDAEDILQNAYIKMLSKIDTLEDPEKFPAWFNRLATNMAIDVWRVQHKNKKDDNGDSYRKVVSFSEFEHVGSDGEVVEYEWEDESIEFRPEEAYTQQETVELVHEMLKNLPEEQKACIVMFYLQGRSIKEIAAEMQVPESTVKSRLNYGKKNIEAQGEELRKKGYQLYSAAPLPLLLYLLRMQRGAAMATDSYWAATVVNNWSLGAGVIAGTGEAVSAAVAEQGAGAVANATGYGLGTTAGQGIAGYGAGPSVSQGIAGYGAGTTVGQGVAGATTTGTTQTAVKSAATKAAGGFLGTLGGKIALIASSLALIVVGAIAIEKIIGDEEDTPTTEQVIEITEGATETIEISTTEATTEEAIDERALLATFYQDTLVPEYGLVPEYQANTQGDACIAGIFCSDIDDYDKDGVLDLYVMYNELTETIMGDERELGGRNYNKHQVLYTIEEGKVVQKSDLVEESALVSLSIPAGYSISSINEIVGLFRESRKMWKLSVDGKIYLFEYQTGGEWRGTVHKVYTYGTDNLELVKSADAVNQGADSGGYFLYDYENGQIVSEARTKNVYNQDAEGEFKTLEEFYSEIGISIILEEKVYAGSRDELSSFENDNLVLYDMQCGGREAGDDVSLWFTGVSE